MGYKRRAVKSGNFIFFGGIIAVLISVLIIIAIYPNEEIKEGNEFYGSYSVSRLPVIFDGYYIQGYSCDNKILISVDDMLRYGFEAEYNNEKNIINFRSTSGIEGSPTPQLIESTDFIAEKSDIDIRINGIKTDAYSLDGYACVSVDSLVSLTEDYNVLWGWSDYNMNGGYDAKTGTFIINNFRFNVSDWNVLLSEMEDLVDDTEIDLYTEGSPEESVYYGARLEPKSGVYAGIVSDGNGDPETGKPEIFHHDFGVYSSYIEFDEFQTDFNKPSSYIIPEKDCLNQVPWNIVDINLALDDENNKYIKKTLNNIKKYNKPAIIRFGAEMNVGTLGDSPSAYVKAFRKIADIIHKDYPNFAVMWSPNDSGSLDRPFWYYYPGDEYVDWVGVSSFSKKTFWTVYCLKMHPRLQRREKLRFTLRSVIMALPQIL